MAESVGLASGLQLAGGRQRRLAASRVGAVGSSFAPAGRGRYDQAMGNPSRGNVGNPRMKHRTAILERHVDIDRLFGAYKWVNLPTRYLRTYVPLEKMQRADERARKRAGKPWPEGEPCRN